MKVDIETSEQHAVLNQGNNSGNLADSHPNFFSMLLREIEQESFTNIVTVISTLDPMRQMTVSVLPLLDPNWIFHSSMEQML